MPCYGCTRLWNTYGSHTRKLRQAAHHFGLSPAATPRLRRCAPVQPLDIHRHESHLYYTVEECIVGDVKLLFPHVTVLRLAVLASSFASFRALHFFFKPRPSILGRLAYSSMLIGPKNPYRVASEG